MSGSMTQPTGVPPAVLAADCAPALSAVKNCATQPEFCMLFQAASTPSTLPFAKWFGCQATGGGVPPEVPARSRSTFGPPLAVVAVARTVLVPAVRAVLNVWSAHVSQLAVGLKASSSATSAPLTVMSIGRFAVLPLA